MIQGYFYIISSLAHSFGLFCLFKRRDVADEQVQYWLLLSLSIIEFVYSFIQVLQSALSFGFLTQIGFYFNLFVYGGVFLLYALIMTAILIDRFLEVRLNLQYDLSCTVARIKRIIIGCIVVSVLFIITVLILLDKTFFALYEFLALYFWPFIALVYSCISVLTYGFIFFKARSLRQPRVNVVPPGVSSTLNSVRWDLRTKKKLFLPSLLIFSFIACWVVPALLTLINQRLGLSFGIAIWVVLHAFMMVGLCFDAVAYVILYKPIRVYIRRLTRVMESRVAPL